MAHKLEPKIIAQILVSIVNEYLLFYKFLIGRIMQVNDVPRAVKSGPTFLEHICPISNVPERLFLKFDFH